MNLLQGTTGAQPIMLLFCLLSRHMSQVMGEARPIPGRGVVSHVTNGRPVWAAVGQRSEVQICDRADLVVNMEQSCYSA